MSTNATKLVRKKDICRKYGFALSSLNHWIAQGIGPKHYKVGHAVFFYESEVDAWFQSRAVSTPVA